MGYWPRAEGMNQIKTSLTPHRPGTARSWSQMITSLMLLGRIHGPPLGGWLNIHINHPDVVKYNPIVFCVFFGTVTIGFGHGKHVCHFHHIPSRTQLQVLHPNAGSSGMLPFRVGDFSSPRASKASFTRITFDSFWGVFLWVHKEHHNNRILKHVHEEHINCWRINEISKSWKIWSQISPWFSTTLGWLQHGFNFTNLVGERTSQIPMFNHFPIYLWCLVVQFTSFPTISCFHFHMFPVVPLFRRWVRPISTTAPCWATAMRSWAPSSGPPTAPVPPSRRGCGARCCDPWSELGLLLFKVVHPKMGR